MFNMRACASGASVLYTYYLLFKASDEEYIYAYTIIIFHTFT